MFSFEVIITPEEDTLGWGQGEGVMVQLDQSIYWFKPITVQFIHGYKLVNLALACKIRKTQSFSNCFMDCGDMWRCLGA